jgi:hypothetical protein
MSSMPIDLQNIDTSSYSYQLPPYPVVDHQAIQNTGIYCSISHFLIYLAKKTSIYFFDLFIDQSSLPAPVIVQPPEVAIRTITEFQRYRQQVICSSCRQQVVTKTKYRISGGTWCMCCVIFFVGGFICCFIPFLMKSCKDVVHLCPECGAVIGRKALM